MASLMRTLRRVWRPPRAYPLRFPTSGFEVIDNSHVLEEERFEAFRDGLYYPVIIGEILASNYQVLGKLGYGTTSTVWLARDLKLERHVALKVYTRNESTEEEFRIYKRISDANPAHPGHCHVRTALGHFTIERPGGGHLCLVQKPMWDSFGDLLFRNPQHRFTPELLKAGLLQLFLALDYLHTECKLVHTDIKADNILQEIEDASILEAFVQSELEHPSARKIVDGAPIYASRKFETPKIFGKAVLGDFGEAVNGEKERHHNAQPDIYRSPEVMLKGSWSYPVDIWNVGTMIWDLFEGKHLFYGNDPDGQGYSTRAHLAEVIGMLGPPPLDLIKKGERSPEFFTDQGHWKADIEIPSTSLEQSECFLDGEDKRLFIELMEGMLQWSPERRKTAHDLLQDPWLNSPC